MGVYYNSACSTAADALQKCTNIEAMCWISYADWEVVLRDLIPFHEHAALVDIVGQLQQA